MAQENVEIVRAMNETSNTADFDLDDWLDEFFDPEIEWHAMPTVLHVFRAGRILRVQQFVTHAEALEVVGLSE